MCVDHNPGLCVTHPGYWKSMIVTGLILLLLGALLAIPILTTVGIVLLLVGLVLFVLGRSGRQFGGRAHYW